MEEIWKDIKGYEGAYQVSNTGKVKSLARKVKGVIGWVSERIRKPFINPFGYAKVILRNGNTKYENRTIARLVAIAFIDNPLNLPCVNHKDGDKSNDNDWNLEWVTQRENCTHTFLKIKKTSRYTNVSWLKGRQKWRASIYFDGGVKNLGNYNSEEEAHHSVMEFCKNKSVVNKYAGA